jgi:[glutamine synthetase] adenylyltransferase / [glutamine synthetase]-adenylyl-L-tyrosine phosphorylase
VKACYELIASAPCLFDEARASSVLADLKDAARAKGQGDLVSLVERSSDVRRLLGGAFGASPFLAALALRDPPLLTECLFVDPQTHLAQASSEVSAALGETVSQSSAMRALRHFKNRVSLLTGLAELGGVWPVETAMGAMSAAANTAVQHCVQFLLRQGREAGQLETGAAEHAHGYFVIGMGKLGASELNYSSDIDLIVFYDLERAGLAPNVEASALFVKLTRDLVRMLQERNADGYVFRTDLRLRPDPGATQIALSTEAGLTYYESFGQNWERAALIKARVIAGDFEAGETFLQQLAPFIWRKYLDFAAIADIHAMKRRVHEVKGHSQITVEGHDIKLGRGGIRDIEFFAQTQQLIAGGRHPELRCRGTVEALEALLAGGWIEAGVAEDLGQSYRFLRRVENRLQMVGDEQTHTIPADTEGVARIAALMGEETPAFIKQLLEHLRQVEAHYGALFEKLAGESERAPLAIRGDEADPAAYATIESLGFQNPEATLETVRTWQSGRYAATRTARAREHLTEFLPELLEAFGRTAQPDQALASFDRLIAELPAGVPLFSLLSANPSLLRLIADIMGTAPRLAGVIAKNPRVLDAVLDPGFFGALPGRAKLQELVAQVLQDADFQESLDRVRIFGREQSFLTGVRVLSGTVTAEQAGEAYSDLAAVLIDSLQERAEVQLIQQHGRVPGGRAAVLAMGKLGGREMNAGSDLDLIVIYDFEGEMAVSDGERSLAGGQYYARLTQRLISALSAPTAEGSLYQVDMRLRPSGNQGPVATRLSSFVDYQTDHAWTWEHLALTRARVISGPSSLRRAIDKTIKDVLCRPRDREKVADEVRTMRGKIEEEKGTTDIWDLKQVRGGLIDVEFIAQFLQVVSAHKHPEILDQNTAGGLSKLAEARVLALADAEVLVPAVRLYHTLMQLLRLCLDKPFVPEQAPQGLKELLARAADVPDFPTLEAVLRETLANTHRLFERIVR